MRSGKPLTDEQRAERRAADREYARHAVEALRSSEGWQRWLDTRARFHSYSMTNQLLLAMERPTAVRVAGFRRWLQLGYCVQKGETALKIWAPVPPSKKKLEAWRAAGANPRERPRTFFKLSPVFADDQVAELPPPAEPAPIHCPIRELEGEDLAPVLPALVALGNNIGSEVRFEAIPGQARGYYEPNSGRIAIETDMSANQQAATLVHELAHALARTDHQDEDPELDYASEELVIESVAFTVVRSLGVKSDAKSIPYLASWAEKADLSVIEQTAGLIDRLARPIEEAIDAEADAEYTADRQATSAAA
jgi:antirestriction protein ArdC